MIVNEYGHIEMADGRTTEIWVGELPLYCVGNEFHYISFRYMMVPDGRVAVHSQVHGPDNVEDFLYEVVDRADAFHCAYTMVEDAEDYLHAEGVHNSRGNAQEFLSQLYAALHNQLH